MSDYKVLEESINNTLNVNALVYALIQNGIITERQFQRAKDTAYTEFKREYPELFRKEGRE